MQEKRFRQAEQALEKSGYTLADFLRDSSRYNSTLLMMGDEDVKKYRELYNYIDQEGLAKGEKGKK